MLHCWARPRALHIKISILMAIILRPYRLELDILEEGSCVDSRYLVRIFLFVLVFPHPRCPPSQLEV